MKIRTATHYENAHAYRSKTAYDLKLSAIDNYLLASGWKREGVFWKPPKDIAYSLRLQAPNWKTAMWRRDQAIQIQVIRDEALAVQASDGTLTVKKVSARLLVAEADAEAVTQ